MTSYLAAIAAGLGGIALALSMILAFYAGALRKSEARHGNKVTRRACAAYLTSLSKTL